jgi:AcrR family transcriptional regulator
MKPGNMDRLALPNSWLNKMPLQGRSRASSLRMLAAANDLMIERGSEDFSLQEICARGRVSTGSIYLRFGCRDNLVSAALSDQLTKIGEEEVAMMVNLQHRSPTLHRFMPLYIEAYAEVLQKYTIILRLATARASRDPIVAEIGKASARHSATSGTAAILNYAQEFGGGHHWTKANSVYQIICATLVRHLGIDTNKGRESDWNVLKEELSTMCLAYLIHAK